MAIPGGMVEYGADGRSEALSATLRRELLEEAGGVKEGAVSEILPCIDFESMFAEDVSPELAPTMVEEIFKRGYKIYEGYSDDPRNTNNAWIETEVVLGRTFRLKTDGTVEFCRMVQKFVPIEGDTDVIKPRWVDMEDVLDESKTTLFAGHFNLLRLAYHTYHALCAFKL
jgi:8-oxo-dGTP pyrophosphatase MutT (NUDIX family)